MVLRRAEAATAGGGRRSIFAPRRRSLERSLLPTRRDPGFHRIRFPTPRVLRQTSATAEGNCGSKRDTTKPNLIRPPVWLSSSLSLCRGSLAGFLRSLSQGFEPLAHIPPMAGFSGRCAPSSNVEIVATQVSLLVDSSVGTVIKFRSGCCGKCSWSRSAPSTRRGGRSGRGRVQKSSYNISWERRAAGARNWPDQAVGPRDRGPAHNRTDPPPRGEPQSSRSSPGVRRTSVGSSAPRRPRN